MTEIASAVVDEMNYLIETLGETIYVYNRSSTAFSSRYHDETPTYADAVSAKGLVVNQNNEVIKQQEGELLRGRNINMRLKASVTIAEKDKVSWNSVNYEVTFLDTKRTENTDLYHFIELTKMSSV